jgi:biopolymer transport protein ExbD
MASTTLAKKSHEGPAQGKVEKMLANIKKEEDKIVYIKSGVGVSYGDVVTVINEVRALGVDKIGWSPTRKKGGERRRRQACLTCRGYGCRL